MLKVGEEIRRALADALIRGDTHEPGLMGASITVSEVRVTPDLRHAIAYVMPLGGRGADEALAALGRAKGELRRSVARAMTTKYTPDLAFKLDDSYDRMDEVRRMFAQPVVARDLLSPADEDGVGDDADADAADDPGGDGLRNARDA
ncbi:ribosome-binding factor A [Rubrimonas cliftonensis]|uniref:Ribosome-binding factor A n=2 Tax=Rubrimonas cliftonensis TaxID=89524 RepID=A0A1H3VZ74_9RHOB|nr:ribosome-binding factor A [Rubrimonas cliftonensis]